MPNRRKRKIILIFDRNNILVSMLESVSYFECESKAENRTATSNGTLTPSSSSSSYKTTFQCIRHSDPIKHLLKISRFH